MHVACIIIMIMVENCSCNMHDMYVRLALLHTAGTGAASVVEVNYVQRASTCTKMYVQTRYS